MKSLAMLRDSLREAVDTKVFYVMVGLSCLVILVVASISYRPVTVEDEVKRLTDQLSWFISWQRGNDAPAHSIDVADFTQTNTAVPQWDEDYRFTLVFHLADAEQAKAARLADKATAQSLEQFLQQRLRYLRDIQVTPDDSSSPAEVRYLVATHGSRVTRAEEWPHEPVVLYVLPLRFAHVPLSTAVQFWQGTLVNWIGAAIALLVSTIITAFFIPNMLRKGTVDLLLVKPIHRSTLLIYKYIGGLTFIFLNTAFVVAGVWLVLGLHTGMWGVGFLASILVITFQFALYYAVSTLFGVLTRSPIVSILMSCLAWFLLAIVVGYGYQIVDATRKLPDIFEARQEAGLKPVQTPEKALPDWAYTTADAIHFVTPRLNDMDVLTRKLIADDSLPASNDERKLADKLYGDFRWSEALSVTSLYIIVLLGLSCWRFATKDY